MKKLIKLTWVLALVLFVHQNIMAQAEATVTGLKPEEFKPVVIKVLEDNGYNITNQATNIETDWKEYTANMVMKYRAKLSVSYADGIAKISIMYKQAWVDNDRWDDAVIPSKKSDEKLVNGVADAINKVATNPTEMQKIMAVVAKTLPQVVNAVAATTRANAAPASAGNKTEPRKPSTAGAKVLKFKPDDDYVFSEGYCGLKKHDLWGFIDSLGNVVVDFKYFSWQGLKAPHFSSGIALVAEKVDVTNYPKFIDKKGQELFKGSKFVSATQFENGIALIGKGNTAFSATFSFINKQGQPIPGAVVNGTAADVTLNPFYEGLSRYKDTKTYTYGYINNQAKWVIQPGKYGEAGDFSDGMAPVQNKTNYYWGYINNRGEEKIPFDYKTKPGNFSEGLAAVQNSNDDIAYIDKTGKEVIPFKFSGYQVHSEFRNGYAVAYLNENNTGYVIIDKAGNVVKKISSTQIKVMKNGWICWFEDLGAQSLTWGILSPEGNEILAPGYFKFIGEFSNGLAWAQADVDGKSVNGFINKNFDFVVVQEDE